MKQYSVGMPVFVTVDVYAEDADEAESKAQDKIDAMFKGKIVDAEYDPATVEEAV